MNDEDYNFLSMVPYYESGWQNIRNYAYNDDPSKGKIRTAQGLWQITNTNWERYAPGLDIRSVRDPSQLARNAMDAKPEDQMRVAWALLKDSGQQNWTAYNPRLAYAVQTGMRARPGSAEEMATFGGGAGGGVSPASYRTGGAAPMDGAATNPDYLKLMKSLVDGGGGSPAGIDGAVSPASYRSGMWPPVPGGGPYDPTATAGVTPPSATSTQPPGWLSNAVGPNAAAAIGSAPRGTVGTGGTGFLGGLTSFLTNPLTQAALTGYFNAIAAPRNTSPFGRIGIGGAAAMDTLAQQERQQQLIDPALQQEMSIRTQEVALKNAAMRRMTAPIPQSSIDRIRTLAKIDAMSGASAGTPEERSHYAWSASLLGNLADGAAAGLYSNDDLLTAQEKFDESKRLQELWRGELTRQQAANQAIVGGALPGLLGGAGGTPPPSTGTPPAGAPAAPAGTIPGLNPGESLPAAMQNEIAQLPGFTPDFTPGRQNVRPKPGATNQWQYNIDGTWWEIGPTGPTVVS